MPISLTWMRPHPVRYFAIACCLAFCCIGGAQANDEDDDGEEATEAKAEFVYELDPYYTDVGYNIPLTHKPIPTIATNSEAVILRELIKGSLVPQYMLVEASMYPMPLLGTYLKKHTPDFYQQGNIGSNFNIIESLTAGFQEPWAVSLFFGNVAKLKRPKEKRKGNNYGYTGYLLSAGTKHIKSNTLVDDEWCELEWKIKGKLEYADEKLSWSFRFGGKFNRNRDVNNVTYINLHRSNTDLRSKYLTWLENTNFDFRLHFLQHGGKLVRSELIAGKKVPLLDYKFIPTFSTGFIWTSPDEYSGVLKDATASKLTFVIRPSVEF
ncbi:MAG: hypothetical protein FD121_1087 [Gallionellaceae bacterium]|nr:MAG: hypothetical protein FD121_1087 [Gallionellaceae bacterium]